MTKTKRKVRMTSSPRAHATEVLIGILRRAGFKAKAVTIEEPNYEYRPCGDGWGPERVPGTHPEHYLVIEW